MKHLAEMSRRISLVLILLLFGLPLAAADAPTDTGSNATWVGRWEGALDVGGTQLPLVMHLRAAADGSLTATLDSPKQNATGIPVAQVEVEGQVLRLDIKALGATYTAERQDASAALVGEWRQSGNTLPLEMVRQASDS